MAEKKIVFFDIDGTVWDWEGKIPQSAKDAVKKLVENGHIPIICSGRAKGHIRDKELLKMGFQGTIAACGGYVEIDGKVLYNKLVDSEVIRKVVELSVRCNVPVVLEGPVKHWISRHGFEKDGFVDRMYEVMGEDAITMDRFDASMNANKFSGDVITGSDYETFKAGLTEYFDFIEHGLTPDVNQRPDKDLNEIQAVFEAVIPGISKAEGIRRICEYLGEDPSEAYAVGDSANDIEMIQCVGTGIAMGNGSKSIKEIADYVTDDIHQDGLYNAMKHFGLI